MSALQDAIKTLLLADSDLEDIVHDRIYVWAEAGKDGVGPTGLPNSVNSKGVLQPLIVIKSRLTVPWGGGHDSQDQMETTRTMVEISFYDAPNSGYNAIESAANLVYGLLHTKLVGGMRLKWMVDAANLRSEVLNRAALIRSDYQAVGIRRG